MAALPAISSQRGTGGGDNLSGGTGGMASLSTPDVPRVTYTAADGRATAGARTAGKVDAVCRVELLQPLKPRRPPRRARSGGSTRCVFAPKGRDNIALRRHPAFGQRPGYDDRIRSRPEG